MNRRLSLAASAATAVALFAVLISAAPRVSYAENATHGGVIADSVAGSSVIRRGLGLSGALRVAVVQAFDPLNLPVAGGGADDEVRYRWVPVFGTRSDAGVGEGMLSFGLQAPASPGVWRLFLNRREEAEEIRELAVITKVPFSRKQGRFLNGYHIGIYPTEGSGRTDRYAPPAGFIEVTPENQNMYISRHFQLRQFLTKDQFDVWPKYVAIDMRLIDKLELVMQELNAMGIRAERMHVMSGYRTPQYNGPGGDGRAQLSRHTYGDAADVWIDNDGDGYVSDLNGDGVRDVRDVELILRAVERVEHRYPELVGGAGVYNSLGSRSPFIHIDVRGTPSRW